ncbi:hypothetical protein GCK32_022185, partial [Trichostrongylus colubriformis]
VIASFVYILELVALIGFLLTKPAWRLIVVGAAIILAGTVFFTFISKTGQRIMKTVEEKQAKEQLTGQV